MPPEKQREIARKGGRAAHARGTAHEFTAAEAREAGKKGGQEVSRDRSHMAQIGRVGGRTSAGRRAEIPHPPEPSPDTKSPDAKSLNPESPDQT